MFWNPLSRKIGALRRRIESGPPAERRAAASELYRMCIEEDAEIPPEALPLLVRMLVDRDAEVSQSGCRASKARIPRR